MKQYLNVNSLRVLPSHLTDKGRSLDPNPGLSDSKTQLISLQMVTFQL